MEDNSKVPNKITSWKVSNLMAPTPRNYRDTNLYREEKWGREFPVLLPPSFLRKHKVKLTERVRYAFEEVLIRIAKKLNGAH